MTTSCELQDERNPGSGTIDRTTWSGTQTLDADFESVAAGKTATSSSAEHGLANPPAVGRWLADTMAPSVRPEAQGGQLERGRGGRPS